MKVIIAGSRNLPIRFDKIKLVADAVYKSGLLPQITQIVSGGCRGIDLAGEMFAENYGIPVKRFLPEWENEGRAAGPIRNTMMADYADALVLIWDGSSRGSLDMKNKAQAKGLKIYEYVVDTDTQL